LIPRRTGAGGRCMASSLDRRGRGGEAKRGARHMGARAVEGWLGQRSIGGAVVPGWTRAPAPIMCPTGRSCRACGRGASVQKSCREKGVYVAWKGTLQMCGNDASWDRPIWGGRHTHKDRKPAQGYLPARTGMIPTQRPKSECPTGVAQAAKGHKHSTARLRLALDLTARRRLTVADRRPAHPGSPAGIATIRSHRQRCVRLAACA